MEKKSDSANKSTYGFSEERESSSPFAKFPMVSRILIFIILPIAIASSIGVNYLRRSLPPEQESIRDPERGGVQLSRDAHGAVSIVAETDAGAFYALGYAQAQDRMWQLELERRIAQGRLSEVFGKNTLREGLWMRPLGLYEAARSAWAALDPDAQAALTSYAAGVNAWLRRTPALPPEFLLLEVKPNPWTPIDSLAWAKIFALSLGGNMWNEIQNLVAKAYLDPQRLSSIINLKPLGLAEAG